MTNSKFLLLTGIIFLTVGSIGALVLLAVEIAR